jgi:hypothetical protein
MKVGYYLAKTVSLVFHPFLIPFFGFVILMVTLPDCRLLNFRVSKILYVVVLLTTLVFPVLFVAVLELFRKIGNKPLLQTDRMLPFFFAAFSVFLGSQLFSRLPAPVFLKVYMLALSVVLIIFFFTTLKWNFSGHAAGMGVLVATVLILIIHQGLALTILFSLALLAAGIVGSALLYLENHKLSEVFIGFGLSFVVMMIVYFLF